MKIIIKSPTSSAKESPVVVALEGRFDTVASQECVADWERVMSFVSQTIVLEMTNLEYVASSGLRMLLALRREVESKGGALQLKGVNAEVMQILKMTGCQDLFSYA